jgi:hypothetical protein
MTSYPLPHPFSIYKEHNCAQTSFFVPFLDMEHKTDSVPTRSPDIPPDRWRPIPTSSSMPSSQTPSLTEHLVLKRAIKLWQSPRHPSYSELSTRLHSFRNWTHSETQTPEYLSEAGFYYDGKFILLILLKWIFFLH